MSTPIIASCLLIIGRLASAAPVSQSELCTQEEMANEIQCMQVLPEASYSYPRGYTVDMHCVIANQHGKVQWRAKSVLLANTSIYVAGYDRSLIGGPRLSMFGDSSKGEHNLRISNISEEDAGEYECQVTPVENLGQPLLRRRTYLTVLGLLIYILNVKYSRWPFDAVIPSHPELKVNDLPLPKDELIISQPDPDPRVEVACYARNGVPAPDFVWLLNDINLNEIANSSKTTGTFI
ncbi:unnamed protein product [Dibothriocephalus latus]|uniref:Ig-like domain-containing protein n=1 Tax=Dibothriocephalus latus TaxID=60516 RepID=A0A3P6TXT2_DIBLA|nr:unnamed protein product [Dibothriocephalus latus]